MDPLASMHVHARVGSWVEGLSFFKKYNEIQRLESGNYYIKTLAPYT